MIDQNHNIPMRKGNDGGLVVDTRPMIIEEWLDTLPYVDFDRTTRMLSEALKGSNQLPMKPSDRIDLIALYNRPYQYYLETQVKMGSQHTLQSIETMQKQSLPLKQIAASLSRACRIAIEETLKKKTLWKQSKPPLDAILMAINYLSHVLIFSYLEYSPAPRHVWKELNFLYEFTEGINQQNSVVEEISEDRQKERSTISNAYKRIILTSMVDPHHLPFGAVWEVFTQLKTWVEHCSIGPFEELQNPSGYFVVDLKNDLAPVPYSKFNKKLAGGREIRLVNASKLEAFVQKQLNLAKTGQPLDDSVVLSTYSAKSLLEQLCRSWGLPPKRYFPRKPGKGNVKLTHGLNSTFYYMNGKQHFIANDDTDNIEQDDEIDVMNTSGAHQITYSEEEWELVDQGAGGFAVVKNLKPGNPVRVGDLVGIETRSKQSEKQWLLGVIRWLMITQSRVYKMGIQTISSSARPVAVKQPGDREYSRAFILTDQTGSSDASIITSRGIYSPDQSLELQIDNDQKRLISADLKESTSLFEYFGVQYG
ncbi:MAG: hypothetical protein R3318_01905 [Gammaproteobacteria bacterium]|nr:hypothetical protein [Gammaproteobacteria bacterium]